jgi:hypothetical protein
VHLTRLGARQILKILYQALHPAGLALQAGERIRLAGQHAVDHAL